MKLKKLQSIGYLMLLGGCLSVVACGSETESEPEMDETETITPMQMEPDTLRRDSIDTSASQRPRDRT